MLLTVYNVVSECRRHNLGATCGFVFFNTLVKQALEKDKVDDVLKSISGSAQRLWTSDLPMEWVAHLAITCIQQAIIFIYYVLIYIYIYMFLCIYV
jgi:hypothetical protein